MPKIDQDFNFEVWSEARMKGNHGLTVTTEKTIILREDVYERALAGHGRDRMTAAHELGHYILHSNVDITFARADTNLKTYECSEWQANCFGGEILVPYHRKELLVGKSVQEIADLCGVSLEAATIQKKFLNG